MPMIPMILMMFMYRNRASCFQFDFVNLDEIRAVLRYVLHSVLDPDRRVQRHRRIKVPTRHVGTRTISRYCLLDNAAGQVGLRIQSKQK